MVWKVHDTIIDEVKYAYLEDGITSKDNSYVHSIVGYMSEEKEVVCDGYAKTFAAVLNYFDIENIFVTGWGVLRGSPISDQTHMPGIWYGLEMESIILWTVKSKL